MLMLSCFFNLGQLIDDLCDAAERSNVVAMERLLLLGVRPDVCGDRSHRTPLHYAALKNNSEVAQMLLERNPDNEARDKEHQTPLHFTAWNNKLRSGTTFTRK